MSLSRSWSLANMNSKEVYHSKFSWYGNRLVGFTFNMAVSPTILMVMICSILVDNSSVIAEIFKGKMTVYKEGIKTGNHVNFYFFIASSYDLILSFLMFVGRHTSPSDVLRGNVRKN